MRAITDQRCRIHHATRCLQRSYDRRPVSNRAVSLRSVLSAARAVLRAASTANVILDHDLMYHLLELEPRRPAAMKLGPSAPNGSLGATKSLRAADARGAVPPLRRDARTESRIFSYPGSGTHTAISSPARCSFARLAACRGSVLIRSPGRFGISDGATTMHWCPHADN